MNKSVGDYFRIRLIVAVIMGAMLSVGWLIVGVPHWLLLGMISGLLSIIPYAASIGWIAAVIVNCLEIQTGSSGVIWINAVLWPSVIYGIIQFIEGWFLTPWLQGKEMDMSSITVLIVLFLDGSIAGFLGMLLAIPLAACIKILINELITPKIKQWAQSH